MRFAVRVTEAAAIDELEAAGWYERQRDGLGFDFRAQVKEATDALAEQALFHPERSRGVRRAALDRFSDYGLYYVVRGAEVVVFAIVHAARNPALVRRRRSFLD